jgi:hypothetical protein
MAERRARPSWHCVELEPPLPKEDHPITIILVCAGNIALWGGVIFLMMTGGY